jgi:hypothetical protein
MKEDFNKMRTIARQLVKTDFKHPWQFKLTIKDAPEDLDFYVKDISYGPTQIENDALKVGAKTLTYPSGAAPVTLSMTVRDNEDERVSKWFDEWAGLVVNTDGTVNLPYGDNGYVKDVTRYHIDADGTESERDSWEMYPVQRGDVTESRDATGTFLEFAVTFIQFRS